MSVLFLGSTKR